MIITPYQSILQSDTREQLGINLEQSIVVFDEAHNVFETVCNMNSTQITQPEIFSARFCLEKYYEKYQGRMGGKLYHK